VTAEGLFRAAVDSLDRPDLPILKSFASNDQQTILHEFASLLHDWEDRDKEAEILSSQAQATASLTQPTHIPFSGMLGLPKFHWQRDHARLAL